MLSQEFTEEKEVTSFKNNVDDELSRLEIISLKDKLVELLQESDAEISRKPKKVTYLNEQEEEVNRIL